MSLWNRGLWAVGVGVLALGAVRGDAADWMRFRGPQGSGVSKAVDLPVRWSEDEGLLWKTELPGPGSSSPIMISGKVFVTCYSGYGVGRGSPGNIGDLKLHVLCVDAGKGDIQWDRSIPAASGEAAYRGIGIPNHGYASSTPTTDGERIFAFFGSSGVVAYDLKGKEIWRAQVAEEPRTHMFGTASSPVLSGDVLVVPASVECEAIVAFDKKTGKEAWRAPATGYGGWWSTPLVVEADGRPQLLFSVPDEIWSLNPETGKLIWYAESFSARALCPSPIVADRVVYAIGGRDGGAAAVKIGGAGDTTGDSVLWTGSSGSYVTSPVVLNGHVYWVSDRGIVMCLKAESGERVFQERLEGAGSVYASLLAADGKLYAVTRRNGTFVLEAKPEFRLLAHNELDSDDTDFNASPAARDGHLLLRSNKALYCIRGAGK